METWEWIVLGVATVSVVLLGLALIRIRRRRSHLRERFGPEYQRAVSEVGTAGGEKLLSEVERERTDLEIRPLSTVARERYLDEWKQAEVRFVSDPRDAVRAAERLVERMLEERGYPAAEDKEHVATLVAVDHQSVAERYRHGHAMLEQVDGNVGTENLRKAMLDFRAVFEEFLQDARTAA